ncbi:IS66 family transposase [Cellulosilyticum ruminicola]|uniref:IS66 family transposase n=1 Tax=Cellulosilyticum ruminicola TaxID=425254 RepID=UPI0009FA3B7E|nr:transposase [Cellulosilyticum ruminicola]
MQYGQNLQALVIALNTIGMVSINRTHEILSNLFCIPISTGTIHKMVTECAQKILPVIDVIKEKMIASPIVHFDEIGTRVDNKHVGYIMLQTQNTLI